MSQAKVNSITDQAGTGAPDFPNGLTNPGMKSLIYFNSVNGPATGSGDDVTVAFDTPRHDTFSGELNTSTGIFTASEAGFYYISASIDLESVNVSNTIIQARMEIIKNSTAQNFVRNNDSGDGGLSAVTWGVSCSSIVQLAISDTLKIDTRCVTSDSSDYRYRDNSCYLSITKLG